MGAGRKGQRSKVGGTLPRPILIRSGSGGGDSEVVPGLELGRAGLVVIDADRHDPNQDGVQAFAGLRAEHQDFRILKRSPLGAGSTTFTGSLSAGLSATGRAIFPKE